MSGTKVLISDLLRIRADKSIVDPVFLCWQLKLSQDVVHQISLIRSGAIMAGINVTKLKSIKVAVPELQRQKKFHDVLRKQRCVLTKYKINDAKLFYSLSQRAFSGKL